MGGKGRTIPFIGIRSVLSGLSLFVCGTDLQVVYRYGRESVIRISGTQDCVQRERVLMFGTGAAPFGDNRWDVVARRRAGRSGGARDGWATAWSGSTKSYA